MDIRCKIWLEKDGEVLFGKGRAELLDAIEEYSSLRGAAKKLNMSYRAAWGRLRASEERLGFKLVNTDPARKGMQLTPEGKTLLDAYKRLCHEVRLFLDATGQALLLDTIQDAPPDDES